MSGREFVIHTGTRGEEELRRTMEDYLLYGQSVVHTYNNGTTEPAVRRVDPADLIMGEGIRAQIENANTTHYEPLIDIDRLIEQLKGIMDIPNLETTEEVLAVKIKLKRGRSER